ncbi:MAG: DUF456 domain-containing protein [Kiritimatiellia bacterium]
MFVYLPGNWLMVLTTGLLAWWRPGMIAWWVVGLMAVLALAGEVFEFIAGLGGARRGGAGWKASLAGMAGALVGAVAGTFLIPVPFVGTLLGGCCGAGLVTWSFERLGRRNHAQSMRAGVGAGVGVFVGTISKVGVGVGLWLLAALSAFL